MRGVFWAFGVMISMTASASWSCGTQDAPCQIGDRSYLIETPAQPAEGNPAIIYMHGYGGSGTSALRNRQLVQAALDRGYAVVAPNGLPMPSGRSGYRWAFRGAEQAREFDFLIELRSDLVTRFGVDKHKMILSGFSNGAFMAAYLACRIPDAYPAYAAIAGGFWRPHPEGCEGPVKLHMTHGWVDGVVPIEGRILRGDSRDADGALVQGDIFRTLEIFRLSNACRLNRPEAFDRTDAFWTRTWESCADGAALEFALHPGGHGVPAGWSDLAIDWFEGQ